MLYSRLRLVGNNSVNAQFCLESHYGENENTRLAYNDAIKDLHNGSA